MFTLADFIQGSIVPGLRLLTRKRDFRQIPIESISVQEFPVGGFIQKNELVLSTALGCMEDLSRFRQLISEAGAAKAAALLLAFEGDQYQVPPDLLQYADTLKLSIFIIPWEQRFSKIQEEVLKNIQDDKTKVYKDLQSKLLSLYFDARPLDQAAELLSSFFSAPVSIEDRGHQIQGASRSMRRLLERDCQDTEEGSSRFMEILVGDIPSGYIHILASPAESDCLFPGNVKAELWEKHICFPLSLWFNQKNIEDMVTVRLKNDFVWNLANQSYDSFEEFARQGARLHFDLSKRYGCLVLKIVSAEGASGPAEYSSAAAKDAMKIEDFLVDTGRELGLDVMFTDRSLQFIIYVESTERQGLLESFIDRIDARLLEAFPARRFFWGISEAAPAEKTGSDFRRLYSSACLALQYCLNAQGRRYHFTYQDTREAQILSALSQHSEIRDEAEKVMAPLLKSESGKELMRTLTEYIAANYNASLTARRLHLHRQSLLYRLERIQELTGMDMAQHRDLFLLEIYSRIFSDY